MEDSFLNEEDKELSEEELMKKLAWTITNKLNPIFAKKKLYDDEVKLLTLDYLYFKEMYEIYLKKNKK